MRYHAKLHSHPPKADIILKVLIMVLSVDKFHSEKKVVDLTNDTSGLAVPSIPSARTSEP